MDFILRACGLRRDAPPTPPPPPPPAEPVARRLRFRRLTRSPANPLLDLPVEVLERCARFGELRTFHGLVVVLGHSRRPNAAALKRIIPDDRSCLTLGHSSLGRRSALFRAARLVEMSWDHRDQRTNTTSRLRWCIDDTFHQRQYAYLKHTAEALEEIAAADDDEEAVDAALAGRRAAAIRLVHETAVYHGVASINGTNKDVGGHETVALVSVARPAPRCSPGAVEAPRVLFAVATNKSTPGFFGHDGQIYERVGVYAVLGPGPANERRAALVDAAWALLDPEGTGFVERASFFDAHNASRHPRVLRAGEEYVDSSTEDEEKHLKKWYKRHAGVDRAGHVSRREFETYYAECYEDVQDDEGFERELDVWTEEPLRVESSSGGAAPSLLRPCSRLVRLVHVSWPHYDRNFDNGDDHEYIHTATAETCADVAERLGVDVACLGYVVKSLVLSAELRGRANDHWEHIERMSTNDHVPSWPRPTTSAFCDGFPRFGRDTGESHARGGTVYYPEGEDLFYHRYDRGGKRRAADHEFEYCEESAHGLFRELVAEVSTRVDLASCASLATLHDKLRGWREVVRARLRRANPPIRHEWDYEDEVQDHFEFEMNTRPWRGV